MILGLTGRNASGKGVAADFLRTKGFYYYSLSDVIRDAVRQQDLEITRENLIQTGRQLRATFGTAYLAEQILLRLDPDKNYVVDSFRHPDEVQAFRQRPDFHLLAIVADSETRFERIKARNRESDPKDLAEFQRLEAREETGKSAEGQDLNGTELLADFTFPNNGSLTELHKHLGELLQRLLANINRPSWDEYFMQIAQVAALRSNCVKRKVAAVIVRDKRVISTGYNGTPRGTKNCYEGGCPRCNSLADSGTKLEECLCSHGEENAITQAAYHGVSVKDATLYTTFAPCLMCTKMIINAGIREVIYNLDYPLNDSSFALFKDAGVICRQLEVK
ncbi:MAG: AAA family ATPase [Acidobacteriota bacterium]|nr:MAG: AAA family ATPase [Acidobacteriota bacterium]